MHGLHPLRGAQGHTSAEGKGRKQELGFVQTRGSDEDNGKGVTLTWENYETRDATGAICWQTAYSRKHRCLGPVPMCPWAGSV